MYKIWLHVEDPDDDDNIDAGEPIDLNIDPARTDTVEGAYNVAEAIAALFDGCMVEDFVRKHPITKPIVQALLDHCNLPIRL